MRVAEEMGTGSGHSTQDQKNVTRRPVPVPTSSAPAKEWMPRLWQGCDFFAWGRLLLRNRFRVELPYLHIAVIVTFVSACHSVLRWLQELLYAERIRATPVRAAPIFIIGHWRTGTTLLHELLILDPRHGFPNNYQCLEPNHFLLTEGLITRYLSFLMPSQRPMDNMAFGWGTPQEDEFALCMMGQPSPYLKIAFPNNPSPYPESLDLERMSPQARARWKRALLTFVRGLTFKTGKRLVLKSPAHACRIKTLLEVFPDARFLHIVRNPYVVFPSTVNLWKTLYETHGLQKPRLDGLYDYVFDTFTHLYAKLEEGKRLIPPGHFHELRYEDLVADPMAEMRTVYERLGLGEFEKVLPELRKYLGKTAGYRTNRYERSPELRAQITHRWGEVIRKYGYIEQTG